jgi:hypothetical protein
MSTASTASPRPWIRYFTPEQLHADLADVALLTGQPARALAHAAAAACRAGLERRSALLAVTSGRAHLDLGDIDQAHAAATRALDLAVPLASRRVATDVRALCEAVATKVGTDNAADLVYRSRTALGAV